MINKYKEFVSAIEMLNNKNSKKFCNLLIRQSHEYYSYYFKKKILAQIKSDLSNRYKIINKHGTDQVIRKQYQLGINTQLVLWFYKRCLEAYWNYRRNFTSNDFWKCVKAPESAIKKLPEKYGLYTKKVGKNLIAELINVACKKAINTNLTINTLVKQCSDQEIFKIRDNVEWILTFENLSLDEEFCFNEMFSEQYIKELIDTMENNEEIVFLKISPILHQLIDKELGGTEIDNATWAYCYNQDGKQRRYKENLSKLKKNVTAYLDYLKMYDSIFKSFAYGYKRFESILSEFDVVEKEEL